MDYQKEIERKLADRRGLKLDIMPNEEGKLQGYDIRIYKIGTPKMASRILNKYKKHKNFNIYMYSRTYASMYELHRQIIIDNMWQCNRMLKKWREAIKNGNEIKIYNIKSEVNILLFEIDDALNDKKYVGKAFAYHVIKT